MRRIDPAGEVVDEQDAATMATARSSPCRRPLTIEDVLILDSEDLDSLDLMIGLAVGFCFANDDVRAIPLCCDLQKGSRPDIGDSNTHLVVCFEAKIPKESRRPTSRYTFVYATSVQIR